MLSTLNFLFKAVALTAVALAVGMYLGVQRVRHEVQPRLYSLERLEERVARSCGMMHALGGDNWREWVTNNGQLELYFFCEEERFYRGL